MSPGPNEEFPWDPGSLSPAAPVERSAIYLSDSMVNEAQQKKKWNKASGISRLCAEMIDLVEDVADKYLEE